MLRLERSRKSFGIQLLFDDVDWFLGNHDRVGLIGRNGTGKSTLLKMLAGQESFDGGTMAIPKGQTVGFLPQFGFETGDGTVQEEARRAFAPLLNWKEEREEIENRLTSPDLDADEAETLVARHDELGEKFRHHGGFEIEREIHHVLIGLGFKESDFERPVRTLSGGWQMRVALARLLLGQPDLLLLDEPTNHLDIEARVWLEKFLADYPGGFVIVSHDRYFLDHTVNRVTEIMSRKLIDYDGNYSDYVKQREAHYEAAIKAYNRQQKEIARIERFIERFRYKNTKAPQVQSRVKMLEKMKRLTLPVPPAKTIHFRFPQPERTGRMVLSLRDIRKCFGDLVVFNGMDFDIERGEKIALVGPNGAGKSTLMRILAGEESLDQGERQLGYRVDIDFFAQDQADRLPPERSLLNETTERAPVDLVPHVRSLLGAFLFRGDDVEKKIGVLSGGERNRFALMLMLLCPSNLLLLDEPTNHLDIDAQEVLLASLHSFEGTVVFVSHDHHFLSRLATRVIDVGGGTVRSHPGDYESFLWKKEQEAERAAAATDPDSARSSTPAVASSEDGRAQTRRSRRDARRLREIEKRVDELEQRRAKLEELMVSDGFYKDQEKSRFYLAEHEAVTEELNRLYEEWHNLDEGQEG